MQSENQDKTGIEADEHEALTASERCAQSGHIIRKTVLMSEVLCEAVEDYRWTARMNFSEAVVALVEVGLAAQRGASIPKR